jgi:hypothetical protein
MMTRRPDWARRDPRPYVLASVVGMVAAAVIAGTCLVLLLTARGLL